MDFPVFCKRVSFRGDVARLAQVLADQPCFFWLDSSQFHPERGRYSFLGWDPFDVIRASGCDALSKIREVFIRGSGMERGSPTPLPAGAVGYISYDYGLGKEGVVRRLPVEGNWPEVYFGFYDRMVTVDHLRQEMILSSTGLPCDDPDLRRQRAGERLRDLEMTLAAIPDEMFDDTPGGDFEGDPLDGLDVQSNFTRENYLRAVRDVLDAISAGELYQLNLSQCFHLDLTSDAQDPLALYQVLRRRSPSPFGGYLNAGDHHLICHSPERFLNLRDRRLATRPMKGTRPRHSDPRVDDILRRDLMDDPKEKAELLMITDLLRNDLGRVCDYGSVQVNEARAIEEYATVYQATSSVEGRLSPGLDAWDVLESCLPGGSITGCPKIRAMQMIETLEPTRRGIYTGVLGYVSFDGDMDFNILIRTMLMRQGRVCFQVGGGIVADSRPEKEYEETLVKARAMAESLRVYIARRKGQVLK